MILETERLILRPWTEEDAPALYRYAKEPVIGLSAGWPPHTSVENSLEIIRTVFSVPETYAVVLRDTNEPIGAVGVTFGEDGHTALGEGEAELGYWLGVPYWGQRLITEAAREIIRHAFADLNCSCLWCTYFDWNERSRRVMDKCGFTYHHTEDENLAKQLGTRHVVHVTRLTREAWNAFR